MIIANNSDDGKKRMAVLTAKSVDSELVEMDCSGMREDVIIDLNEEGRRWEGGELNGKPFGYGYTHSNYCDMMFEINDRNFAIVYSSQHREFKLTNSDINPGVNSGRN